jgi:hypothetical protein
MKIVKRGILHLIFISVAFIFSFTILVLFSWNSFAPDLFQLPAMKFKQAFGLVLFIGCISFLLRQGRNHPLSLRRITQSGADQQ